MIELRNMLNLDKQELDSLTLLVHGGYATGKTHLLGDALCEEAKNGPVFFLNVKGEDGTMTLRGQGLGSNAATVETVKDYEAALEILHRHKLQALALDSLKALNKLIMGDTMPEKSDYIPIHWTMERLVKSLRACAKYVICSCPSDRSVNQLDGSVWITPDLPGREAMGVAGWFNFVG